MARSHCSPTFHRWPRFSVVLVAVLAAHVSGADTRFAVIGDFGDDSTSETDVANRLKQFQPSFIATVGDNHYLEDGAISDYDTTIGSRYGSFIKYPAGSTSAYAGNDLDVNNFYPALGNHDIETDHEVLGIDPDHPGAIGGSQSRYFQLPGNERYYDVVRNNVHLFFLSSDTAEPDGQAPGSVQRNWFNARFAASTSKWKVVLFHHPAYSTDAATGDHASNGYMQWGFAGATIVYNGHAHTYERNTVDGITYIVDGTGGATASSFQSTLADQGINGVVNFRDQSGEDGDSQHGFTIVDAADAHYTTRHYTHQGNYLDHATFLAPGVNPIQSRTLKQNVAGYSGARDTQLTENAPTTSSATATTLRIGNDEPASSGKDAQMLLRFDNLIGTGAGQVPLGATVSSGTLRLRIVEDGDGFAIHRLLANWNEASTWTSTDGGIALDGVEALAAYEQTAGVANALEEIETGYFNLDVTRSIQAWANGAINMGWVLSALAGSTDGIGIASANSATPPELFVEYIVQPRGDFNADNLVNAADITALFKAQPGSIPPAKSLFDLNYDGVVNPIPGTLGSDADVWVRSLKQTEYGDANLDGDVDFDDLLVLARNYNAQTGRTWSTGDFTGNSAVTFDDLLSLARHYGFGTAAAGLTATAFAEDWALAQALTPEPGSALLAIGVGPLIMRRRR